MSGQAGNPEPSKPTTSKPAEKSDSNIAASSGNDANKNHRTYVISILILLAGILIAGGIIFYQPVSDYFVLRNADPSMTLLAQQAGMSKKGELVFLRTHPEFATDSQMGTYCADNAAANNKNGFIEQGCYIPNARDHSTGRIYIRQMPANLYDQEIVTAAYEMLHSVYFGANGTKLVEAVEANYHQLHNAELDSQLVNFTKTEPGYRDLELFSLLATEHAKLSVDLEAYYAPYFQNRSLTVDSYNKVTSIFQDEQSQLKKIQQVIATDDSLANKAYADSLAWAKAGNAYEDSYDYQIYKNYIAQENAAISQFNQLSQAYNTLVAEYNGAQPVAKIQAVTTQGSR